MGRAADTGHHRCRKPVPARARRLYGKLFGDKGYLSQPLFHRLLTELGVQLITYRKRNMANRLLPLVDKRLLRKRALTERIFDQLKNISQIEHIIPTLTQRIGQSARRTADITIACMGLSPQMEGEEGSAILSPENGDRSEITLPDVQVAYLTQLAQRTNRIVLVLSAGSPIALGEIQDLVQAIAYVWCPGQAGGHALADILFGRSVPSGRLPLTFPHALDHLPPYDDYSMAGRTYRYMTSEPLFPFGFGLSYSGVYDNMRLDKEMMNSGDSLAVGCRVTNQGSSATDEVVQAYISDVESSVPVPLQRLVAFKRVQLQAGETHSLSFTLGPETMSHVDDEGHWQLEPGEFHLSIGGCSPGTRGQELGAAPPVVATFRVID